LKISPASAAKQEAALHQAAANQGQMDNPTVALVQITDAAEPQADPVKPNKTLDITLGAILGLLLGVVAGSLAAFLTQRLSRRAAGPA
jgi:uncharacterized protein involved in exopolysaccharide biosynthesis